MPTAPTTSRVAKSGPRKASESLPPASPAANAKAQLNSEQSRLGGGSGIAKPLQLLGGLSPSTFMRKHWQRKPLLIRSALDAKLKPLLSRTELFALAAQDGVESRLVRHTDRWHMAHGPFERRALPALSQREWTLLVQGVDLHHEGAHELLQKFNFLPAARLDDLMISYASDGGGVGPHFDSYDVFLLQVHGQRRWRIGQQKDLSLRDDVPLKVLAQFEPTQEFLLNPGDMLYLPPKWAHDGVAVGECMTYSIGFRAPERGELQRDILLRLADNLEDPVLYTDRDQEATETPGMLPKALLEFAMKNVAVSDREYWTNGIFTPQNLEIGLGETLSEPKAQVWFDGVDSPSLESATGLRLDRRSKMYYTDTHVFLNGESWLAGGADARLMRSLADTRRLDAAAVGKASKGARHLLLAWLELGWVGHA